MKRFNSPALSALGAVVLTAWFTACGGLDDGAIVIVDSGGSTNDGGTQNSGGNAGADGGTQSSGGSAGADGGEGGEPPIVISKDPPVVVSITPEDEESGVSPDGEIEIEFSESLDPDTVTSDTVVVREGDRIVSGELSFSGVTLTFTPEGTLTLLGDVSVTVTTDVTDLEGTALEEEFVSSFQVREGEWGNKIEFNNPGDQTIQTRFPPAPAMDADGNALLVWAQSSEANPGYDHVIWGRFFTRGEGWGDSFPISVDGYEGLSPSVAMDGAGDAIVSWVQRNGEYEQVYARRYVAGTWEESPQRIDNVDHDQVKFVETAISPAGEMHVAWTVITDVGTYETIYSNQVAGLADWDTTDTYRYGSYDEVGGPSLEFDADGNGFMVWFANDGTNPIDVRVGRYVKDASIPWKSQDTIPAGVGVPNIDINNRPEIVTDPDGGALVVWKTNSGEITSSRFTKASGWTDAAPVDASDGLVTNFGPRVARVGEEFVAAWIQDVEGTRNYFSSRYVDGAWQAMPDLVSDGDTSIGEWGGIGFGLDRNGNGIGAWSQEGSVYAARLIGASQSWQEGIEIDTPTNSSIYPVMEVEATAAPNGVVIVTYAAGYAYNQSHDHLYAVVFE